MATKKFINTVEHCVDENLEGVVRVNSGLRLLKGHRVIIRGDIEDVKKAGQVTLLSGGGSGHEPAHAGYVGPGMLSGAIAGSVFASPPPSAILAAIHAVGDNNQAGTLLIVTNYTGDRLTFGMAGEQAKSIGLQVISVYVGEDCALTSKDKTAGRRGLAGGTLLIVKNYTGDRINFGIAQERGKAEGLSVDMVIIGEDCALATYEKTAGKRGLCGTVLIHKIAGALANQGKSLKEIAQICREAASTMGTMGVTLSPCSVPGSGASFQLAADELELGLGIHGEAGVKRMKMMSAKEVVTSMINHMTNKDNPSHVPLEKGNHVAIMINNLGGTSVLELNIIAKEAVDYLETFGVLVDRAYCGSFMTSLEMAGVSITILHLNDLRKKCLDAPTNAPAWPQPFLLDQDRTTHGPMESVTVTKQETLTNSATVNADISSIICRGLQAICTSLINSESLLNDLDKESGDGDCGSTLKTGAKAIQMELGSVDHPTLPVSQPYNLLISLAGIVENTMGGTSGGLYSLFLTAAAGPLLQNTSVQAWLEALKCGMKTMQRYGGAEPGDRTMLDSFCAAEDVLTESLPSCSPINALEKAVKAAEKQAKETALMQAKAGRASYVGSERSAHPDPGATAVAIWLRALYESIKTN